MPEELTALEQLQLLDMKVITYRNDLTEIPKNLESMRNDVAHVGDLLKKETARLEEAEEWRTNREKEIILHNDLLAKAKSKLMSARNEKENKAAQREIDTVRKTIQEREEEAIKIMEAIEQYRNAIAAHTQEFAELESQLKDSEEEGKVRLATARQAVEANEVLRQKLIGGVPQQTLKIYERVHRKLGRALADVVDGHCAACNMDLSPQMFIEVQRGTKIHQCPTCQRLLIYKAPLAQPDAE